jgi:DHA1 family bicyclomycin/chloramphenicol resistance-like MFS transporter
LSSASLRTVLPLGIVTGTSMLAMDLYLPAVPTLQGALGIGVAPAQATIALFLAGLAGSQLLWGEALNRLGPRRCVALGVSLLVAGSIGAALAPGIEVLLAMRLLQGIAAGAATVVAPSVVRASLSDEDAVRGIATISMIEAIVPAAGPVLGTLLLLVTDWRGTFWVLAAVTLVALPFAVGVTPRLLPGFDRSAPARWRDLLVNGRFVRLALSHATSVGALLTFVASAPQLLQHAFGLGPSAFATLQVCGVASFIAMASQSGRISARIGTVRAVQVGAGVQLLLCALALACAWAGVLHFVGLVVLWGAFCGALAVRGPAAFSLALDVPPALMGRASALLVLLLLIAGALGTQGVAPFMDGRSAVPIAATLVAMCALSLALVVPAPATAGPRA